MPSKHSFSHKSSTRIFSTMLPMQHLTLKPQILRCHAQEAYGTQVLLLSANLTMTLMTPVHKRCRTDPSDQDESLATRQTNEDWDKKLSQKPTNTARWQRLPQLPEEIQLQIFKVIFLSGEYVLDINKSDGRPYRLRTRYSPSQLHPSRSSTYSYTNSWSAPGRAPTLSVYL